MPQLPQRPGLDLPYAFTGYGKIAADFFKRPATAICKTEPELKHAAFAMAQSFVVAIEIVPAGGPGDLDQRSGGRIVQFLVLRVRV